jgi:histidine triad (HIT) family protein
MIDNKWFTKPKLALYLFSAMVIGIIIGGYLFSTSQPRSILSVFECKKTCLKPSELAGLVASVGIQKFPSFIPQVIIETDKTIVFKHPLPHAPIHYVIVPKKDIKNIGEISVEDREYTQDMIEVIAYLIKKEGLTHYQVYTNSPDTQLMTYLHFHLVGYPK